jgi:hypothetical protein
MPKPQRKPVATPSREMLDDYVAQSPFSSAGRHTPLLRPVPADAAKVASVVQGLVLYEHVASDFYGVDIPNEQRGESHIRHFERMLDSLLAVNEAPLPVLRTPPERIVGVCHHFMLMAVALLRDKGVPARARCGFGAYFNPGYFEDHWVCEYWNAVQKRWVLLDAQFDDIWKRNLKIRHDVLDVPRDQFLTASDAWSACRKGKLDPAKFGIEFTHMRGLWFIGGSLVRDLAALNKMELLPWDSWGTQPAVNASFHESELAFFDELALLTATPDDTYRELRKRYEHDPRLRVPPTVFNVLKQREENVQGR